MSFYLTFQKAETKEQNYKEWIKQRVHAQVTSLLPTVVTYLTTYISLPYYILWA